MNATIKVFDEIDQITIFLLHEWKREFMKRNDEGTIFTTALSGGQTPIPFYQGLSKLEGQIPWESCHFFMVDERFIQSGHPEHNYSNIENILFRNITIPQKNIHKIKTNSLSPVESAKAYEENLKYHFKNQLPSFNFVILGMGVDGHTASLFPSTDSVNEENKFVTISKAPSEPLNRITITFPVINNSENIYVLATGKNKSMTIKNLFNNTEIYPISKILNNKKVIFLIDREASS